MVMKDFFDKLPIILSRSEQEVMDLKTGRDEIGNFMIDTCWTDDEGFETGIKDKTGSWFIVERYENEEKAIIGHKKWKKFIEDGNRKVPNLYWSDVKFLNRNKEVELQG